MNLALENVRDPACTMCRMSMDADRICMMGSGPDRAKIMVVGKMPNSKGFAQELELYLREVGLDPADMYFSSAIKCRNFERNPTNKDVKTCKSYLDAELEVIKPKWVLALGNEALLALTGHSGIMKYRGKPVTRGSATIIPTISPSSVKRNPGQRAGFVADLQFFANEVGGVKSDEFKPDIKYIDTMDKLKKLGKLLGRATTLVYDIESVDPGTEFHPDARMVSISFTFVYKTKEGKKKLACVAIPLYHPESPFLRKWKAVLRYLAPVLEAIPVHMGHNTKYDARWCRQFGIRMRTDHDSLLMAHTLDENRQKGLKPQAQSRLGVAPWGIDTRSLIETPLYEVLKYNALDTFYTWHISLKMLKELKSKPRQYRIYKKLLMPASETYVDAERNGVWMDRERLATRTKIAYDMRDELERQLMEWVPEPGTHGWPKQGKREKPVEINFNASNWLRWWLFEYLDFPILERGKEKDDGRKGDPSVKEAVIQNLTEATQHPALLILAERSKWQKYCSSFLSTYEEQLDENDRLHTTYKLHGTVTGRTSSGKIDEEKITAAKGKRRRGVNLQQVPRDPFIRGLFGAPPGRAFVEADFSQVELRIAAFVAREKQMLHLYATGVDLHTATAAKTTGKPLHLVTKEERKKAKPTNFGFLYGMSWTKFVTTAWENYGIRFTPAEAEATRIAFFDTYPDLQRWYIRQRRLVREFGRVESPMGRVRHLPDIYSADRGVQAEAERQAINSPVQAMASDMLIFGMTLLEAAFKKAGIDALIIGTVHDAVNFDISESDLARALPLIKHTLENLPLEEVFDVRLDVPIIADLKAGSHWGDAIELTEEEVNNFDAETWRGRLK